MKIQLALTMAILLAVAIGAVASEYFNPTPSEPQLYTVHFDGIDYQDLSCRYCGKLYSSYITKSGKRIEFHGNFYEVEQ